MRWRLGLRSTLLVSLLPLLTLPWIGLRFVDRMAELARDERMENQASAARALAAALHERRDLFEAAPGIEPTPPGALSRCSSKRWEPSAWTVAATNGPVCHGARCR